MLLIRFLLLFCLSCGAQSPDGASRSPESGADFDASAQPIFLSGVRAILQDRQGHYWFGSHAEGVCRYDGTTMTYYTVEDGLADQQVRSIQEDEHGRIWFGTARGVSRYEAGKGIATVSPTNAKEHPAVWQMTVRDLWFNAGNQPGVYRWDGQALHYLAYPDRPSAETTGACLTTCSAGGRNGMLWLGTYGGVFGFDGEHLTVLNNQTLGLQETGGILHVRSLLEDSEGRLWIGNNGIGVLLMEGDSVHNFSDRQHLIHPFSARDGAGSPPGTLEHVFAIGEDQRGHIWFGDRDTGVWRYDGETMINYPTVDGQPMPMTWCMQEDRQGDLLFGMANGFVFRFNGQGFERAF